MYSSEFQILIAEARRLKRQYLDFSDESRDSLLDENQEKIRIFQIFLHAEMENYFEKTALNQVVRMELAWNTSPVFDQNIQRLSVYSPAAFVGNSNQVMPNDRILFLLQQLKIKINSNHGVKEKDIYSMLLPAGFPITEIPATLVPTLDSFGGTRGKLVHNSVRAVTVKMIRSDVVQTASQLMRDIRNFENNIRRFRASPSAIF